jgi:hypothetical protein
MATICTISVAFMLLSGLTFGLQSVRDHYRVTLKRPLREVN